MRRLKQQWWLQVQRLPWRVLPPQWQLRERRLWQVQQWLGQPWQAQRPRVLLRWWVQWLAPVPLWRVLWQVQA